MVACGEEFTLALSATRAAFSFGALTPSLDRDLFVGNLWIRVNFIIVTIRWTGLAPWKFELPFPGRPTSTFPKHLVDLLLFDSCTASIVDFDWWTGVPLIDSLPYFFVSATRLAFALDDIIVRPVYFQYRGVQLID